MSFHAMKVLTFGKIKKYFVFRSLIRTFAPDLQSVS